MPGNKNNNKLRCCVHCKTVQVEQEFHEIFGELGVGLHLPELVKRYFKLELAKTSNEVEEQLLCDDCVNRLIELFDGEERDKGSEVEPEEGIDDPMVAFEALGKDSGAATDTNEQAPDSVDESEETLYDGTEIPCVELNCENCGDIGNTEVVEEAASESLDASVIEAPDVAYSQSHDCVDVEAYLDSAINSKLEDLQLQWSCGCSICGNEYGTFQELLRHPCARSQFASLQPQESYRCVIKDCRATFPALCRLARHLLLKHCDLLPNLQIYGSCPECEWRFSNFYNFNKHSCCRSIKRKVGIRNYCDHCKVDFPSFKRFAFHMQFHMAQRRPKVCLICEASFSDGNEFFEHVHYSHEPANSLSCTSCDRTFKEQSLYEKHKRAHTTKTKYECSYCPKKYDHRHLLTTHLDVYHNYQSRALQCEFCEKEFVSTVSYRKHMKSHTPEAEVCVYVCRECGMIACECEDLQEHTNDSETICFQATVEEEIVSVAYTCENCSLDFRTITDLRKHRSSSSHKSDVFVCALCRETFAHLKRMRNHMKSHMSYEKWQENFPICRLFMCNIGSCEEVYPLWTSLYYHKKRHHDAIEGKSDQKASDEFKCQFCAKLCTTKMSLAVHVARSHNNKNVNCPHCKGSYKDSSALQEHIDYMHTQVQCPSCHKVIKNRRNLVAHEIAVHKNVQRYFCNKCDKGFYYKSEKEAHERNIHPEVNYKCDECGFTTNYHKSLLIHVAKHKQQLEFRCPLCGRGFGRKHVLDVHIRRHQVHREFVCSERIANGCDASFVSNYLLNKHIKQKHNETEVDANTKPVVKRSRKSTKVARNPSVVYVDELIEMESADNPGTVYVIGHEDDCFELVPNSDNECVVEYIEAD